MKPWESLTTRERDAWVAHTFGLATTWAIGNIRGYMTMSSMTPQTFEEALKDASRYVADEMYCRHGDLAPVPDVSHRSMKTARAIREAVLSEWPPCERAAFVDALRDILTHRNREANGFAGEWFLRTRPGDEARAAYEALAIDPAPSPLSEPLP